MKRTWRGPVILFGAVFAIAIALAASKYAAVQEAAAELAKQPEPMEAVAVATAKAVAHRESTTSIGTVLALQSVRLRNELAGTIREVTLIPGRIVDAGTVLVRFDVSVEEAELAAHAAQAAAAEALLRRVQKASEHQAASDLEVDQARAERDVARAQIAKARAVIERKTLRAPFRARVGIADVHPGQYLNEGTEMTTLQSVDESANVDFAVAQNVAASLAVGATVEVFAGEATEPLPAEVVAIDARVDPATRNALVRARISSPQAPSPGASVRVRVPVGVARAAVVVPVSALRKSPAGDHVFVIAPGKDGVTRAHLRAVASGSVLGDDVVIERGLVAGETIATSGSFKLREAVRVAVAGDAGKEPTP